MNPDTLYFDQAAAARPDPEVLDFCRRAMAESFANQEAAHRGGYALREELQRAAAELSTALTGEEREVIWGGSGSELLALFCDSPLAAGKNVWSSRLEHPALGVNLRRTAGAVGDLAPDAVGRLGARLPDSIPDLLAVHTVQSELGVRQEYSLLAAAARERNPQVVTFADAIQSAGKLELPCAADIIAVSGHKFGAPGGAALLCRPGKNARTLRRFAEQRRHADYRLGRPEPALMRTLAFAAVHAEAHRRERTNAIQTLNHQLRAALAGRTLPGGGTIRCTVPEEQASPYILHLLLPKLQSGVLLRMFSEQGILLAAGSACASESREPSAALRAIKVRRDELWSGLRLSFLEPPEPEACKKLLEAFDSVLKNY